MTRLGMFEPATLFKVATPCRRCGYKALYWHMDSDSKWRLHHWSAPQDGGRPRFVLHRCGFDSWGRPKTAQVGTHPQGGDGEAAPAPLSDAVATAMRPNSPTQPGDK